MLVVVGVVWSREPEPTDTRTTHCGELQECSTSQGDGGINSSQTTAAYRTNAQLMALAEADTGVADFPVKAVDIPLSQSGLRLPTVMAASDLQASGGLRADLRFVAATGRGVPDTMGAVGPTQYLLTLNSIVRSFNKATGQPDGVLDLSLHAFFGAGGLSVCCDPKVRFDRLSGRWFVGAMGGSNILLAVSDGSILGPASGWRFFSIPQEQVPPAGDPGCWLDYTRMAVDEHAVYFVFGMFAPQYTGRCPSNQGNSAFVIRKASVLGAGPPILRAFRGTATFSVPVDQFETGSPFGYIMTGRSFRRVIDPGGVPSLSPEARIAGAPIGGTQWKPVRHRGNMLETGIPDKYAGRMFLAAISSHSIPYRRGRLWLGELWGLDHQGRIDPGVTPTRNGLGFLEIRDVDDTTPTVVQFGVLFQPSATNDFDQRNYWMPALMVNGQGHLLVAGSSAGTNEYINAAVAGRLTTDAPGAFRAPLLLTQATAAYNPPTYGEVTYRWGDYSNISLDPTDDMTMWAVQQFAVGGDVWGIVVARIRAPGPPPSVTAEPAAIFDNTRLGAVTVTGTSIDGEGFYDPGAGFAGRLRIGFDRGVRVNRVDLVSPTSLVLEVSTECAANGPHTLTIVNPDGQSVTVPGALTTTLTPEPLPTAPRAPTLTGSGNTNTISLHWVASASGCEPTSYILEAGSRPGASNLFVGPVGAATSLAASVPAGLYYVRVRGTNDIGTGPPSNEVEVLVGIPPVPGPPTSLTGTVSGQNVMLSWQHPTSGGPIQDYVLEAGSGPGLANLGTFVIPGAPTFSADGVPPGAYHVRVRARNAGGLSAPSNETAFVVLPAYPGAPTNLAASVAPGGRVLLLWDAPAPGPTVSGYRIEAGSGPGLANLAVLSIGASPTAFIATGVPPGHYFVRVIAVNAAGSGGASNEVLVVVQ